MRAFVDFPISFIMPTPALQRANILLRLREEFRIHPHETRNEILDVLSTSPINDWYSLWTKLAVATKCDQDPSMYICLFGTDLDSGFDFIIKHIIVELCNMLLGNPTSRVKNYRSQGIPLYPPVIQAVIRAGCNTSLLSLIERSFHACTTHSMFTLPVNCNTRNNVLSYFK
jgi:hypothetical protein